MAEKRISRRSKKGYIGFYGSGAAEALDDVLHNAMIEAGGGGELLRIRNLIMALEVFENGVLRRLRRIHGSGQRPWSPVGKGDSLNPCVVMYLKEN